MKYIIIGLVGASLLAGCGTEDMDENNGRGEDNPPALGAQIDRMGRPAINTALNLTFAVPTATKDAGKDQYNAAAQSGWSGYIPEFRRNLAILDALDGNCGNQLVADQNATRYAFLATVLVDDQLYVNTGSGTCGTYLGLEAEIVGAVPAGAGGCGGRTPADDVISRSYSVLAAGVLSGVDDTIASNDVALPTEFPFLSDAQ